jgi:hypothetical protein
MMKRLVYGIGVNDVDYAVKSKICVDGKDTWVSCPFYETWKGMLRRCYSVEEKPSLATYVGVLCCNEWTHLSVFKSWMEKQDWKGKHLDKDIILSGNKVYSPDTCAFVLPLTNSFVTDSGAIRGNLPLGVCASARNPAIFYAQCRNPFTKKKEHLGSFKCPNEAHETWRKRKHELAQIVSQIETDPRIVEALRIKYSVPHSGTTY